MAGSAEKAPLKVSSFSDLLSFKKITSSLPSSTGDSLMLALEPRLLFDAAGLIAGLDLLPQPDALDLSFNGEPEQTATEPVPDLFPDAVAHADPVLSADVSPSSVVFIDSGVTDYESLVSDIAADTRVVFLDSQSNGIAQIRDVLAQYEDVESVHIISHGDSGSIFLGDTVLSNDTLDTYAATLQDWGSSLTTGADILIYGCNVAQGTQGQSFVAQLSDITGADVAASDDVTGAKNLGGDWQLETRTGIIESGLVVSEQAQAMYSGTLADITVTGIGDNIDAMDGVITLREALTTAEANNEADTITFDASLNGQNITMANGTFAIAKADGVTIMGNGSTNTIISGDYTYQVFNINAGAKASLDGLYIFGGYNKGTGGGIYNAGTLTIQNSQISYNFAATAAGYGGGIFNDGTLTIDSSSISRNYANKFGGGIINLNTLTVNNSTISENYAYVGGGIYNDGTLTVNNSTISGNYANKAGGGIVNLNTLTVNNSTISENYAYGGGGIYNDDTLTVNNSTISGNYAYVAGGGIFNSDTLTIDNSTISENLAYDYGAGIHNKGTATIENSTISSNYVYAMGGGISNLYGNLTVESSTISSNYSDYYSGGGIFNRGGTATIDNSTIWDNSAYANGGGIYNFGGDVTCTSSTISGNTISSNIAAYSKGGGIYNGADAASDLFLYHSTIADNDSLAGSAIFNCGNVTTGHTIMTGEVETTVYGYSFPISSQGYNLFTQSTVAGSIGSDLVGANANLLPLADNGGPTLTHALGKGSQAYNGGDSSLVAGVGSTPSYDQRGVGYSRITGIIDIGAIENNSPTAYGDNFSTDEDTPILIDVLANDVDPELSDPLYVINLDTSDMRGTLTSNEDGTYVYDPRDSLDHLVAGDITQDSFKYMVEDSTGAEDPNEVEVIITVSGAGWGPSAADDAFITHETASITMDVLGNDENSDISGTVAITGIETSGTQGTVTQNEDGTVTYNPNGRFDDLLVGQTAQDTFVYTMSGSDGNIDTATVTVTIAGVQKGSNGLIFYTPLADPGFDGLFSDPKKTFASWYQIWTGNEAGTEGSYVDTSEFYAPGNGWIEGSDLAGLFPDYCQYDDTALWVRSWTQADGYGDWAACSMPFQDISSVVACETISGPAAMDLMFNDENASSGYWYRIWVGDSAREETVGSYLDTGFLQNGTGLGWARASELALLSLTAGQSGTAQELWVESWSPETGSLGWEHWTVTCTEGTSTAAAIEQDIGLTDYTGTESVAMYDPVEPDSDWQQVLVQTNGTESDITGSTGFNEQLWKAGNQFEFERNAFLDRLS